MEETDQPEAAEEGTKLYATSAALDDSGLKERGEAETGILPHEWSVMDEERIEPTKDLSINSADVLCGRGKQSFNHVGNKRFREMVAASLDDYIEAGNRFEKSLIIHRIVDQIQAQGGRFLKVDSQKGKWSELTQQQSKEKVGHAIRDAANLYLSRQQRTGTQAPAGEFVARLNPDASVKATPSYSEGSYEYSAREVPAKQRLRATPNESLEPESDSFDMRFSSIHFDQSPMERTTPQRLLPASNVLHPYNLSMTQNTVPSRQPDLSQARAYRQRQQMHSGRQPSISVDPSSALSDYLLEADLLNRSDRQNVRRLQPPVPTVPEELGFGSFASSQQGLKALARDLSTSDLRPQHQPLPYPPPTTSVARAFHPYDRISREQMLLQEDSPNRQFRRRSLHPHDRLDDNDHFLDVINAVLGPMGHDAEDDIIPPQGSNVHDEPQHLLYQPQLEYQQPSQQRILQEENDEDDRKPSPKDRR